jgi:hypothetical protein
LTEISKYALPATAFMTFAIIGAFPLNATCQIAPSYRIRSFLAMPGNLAQPPPGSVNLIPYFQG